MQVTLKTVCQLVYKHQSLLIDISPTYLKLEMGVEGLSFHKLRNQETKYLTSYHMAHLSILPGSHNKEFLFGCIEAHFLQLSKHLDHLVLHSPILIETRLHSILIIVYFQVSMKNI